MSRSRPVWDSPPPSAAGGVQGEQSGYLPHLVPARADQSPAGRWCFGGLRGAACLTPHQVDCPCSPSCPSTRHDLPHRRSPRGTVRRHTCPCRPARTKNDGTAACSLIARAGLLYLLKHSGSPATRWLAVRLASRSECFSWFTSQTAHGARLCGRPISCWHARQSAWLWGACGAGGRRSSDPVGGSRVGHEEASDPNVQVRGCFQGCGRYWVRTSVGEADGFTDRSLWPLGQPAGCCRATAT